MKEKCIEAIKEIRKREDYHFEKADFCREHNMKLDEIYHQQMEHELRRLASKLSEILGTGYVSLKN